MTTYTATASGSPTTTGSGWTNTTNATGANNSTFATFTNAVSAGVGTITLPSFGTSSLSLATDGSVSVSSVTVTVWNNVATTARWTSVTTQLLDSTGTAIGPAIPLTLSATTTNNETITFGTTPTVAQVNAGLQLKVTATHTGTTSSTFNLDAVSMSVNYAATASTTPVLVGAVATQNVNGSASVTSVTTTVNAPAGNTSGNLLVAVLYNAAALGSPSFTTPSGWTASGTPPTPVSGSAGLMAVFWKIAGGSEPTTYSFVLATTSGQPYFISATVLAYKQVDETTPVSANAVFSQVTTSTTAPAAPSVTPSTANGTSLLAYGAWTGFSVVTPPSGYAPRVAVADAVDSAIWTEDAALTAAAGTATGTKTATSRGDKFTTMQLVLNPVQSTAFSGSADFAATGSINPSLSSPGGVGGATFGGSGSIVATGTAKPAGSVAFTAAGALTATGTPAPAAVAALGGSAALSATQQAITVGPATANLAGTGTLASAATLQGSGSAGLAGAAALSATGTPKPVGTAAAFSGSATLGAVGSLGKSSAATLGGSGTVTATGVPGGLAAAALTGSGALGASGTAQQDGSGTPFFSGSAALTALGVPGGSATVGFTGGAVLSATGAMQAVGSAAFTGGAALTATNQLNLQATAALTGSAALTPAGTPRPLASAAGSASATLTVTVAPALAGSVALGGSAALTAVGTPLVLPFTDPFTGADGSALSPVWTPRTAFGAVSIQGNAARVVTATGAGFTGARVDLTGAGLLGDSEITGTLQGEVAGVDQYAIVSLNSDAGASNFSPYWYSGNRAYFLQVAFHSSGGDLSIWRTIDGDESLRASTGTLPLVGTTKYGFRFQRIGQVLNGRVWDAATSEPSTWDISYTLTDAPVSGWPAIGTCNGSDGASRAFDYDDVTVSVAAESVTSAEGAAPLNGAAALSAVGTPGGAAVAALGGAGSLASTGQPRFASTVSFGGAAVLLPGTGRPGAFAGPIITGTAALAASGTAGMLRTALLTAAGTLTAPGAAGVTGAATLGASAGLTVLASPTVIGLVPFAATGQLQAVALALVGHRLGRVSGAATRRVELSVRAE